MEIVTQGSSPITLDMAKEHLRVDHDRENDLITTYIQSAYSQAEKYTWRKIARSTIREYAQSWPAEFKTKYEVETNSYTVKYLDQSDTEQTLAQDLYGWDRKCKSIYCRLNTVGTLPEISSERNSIWVEYETGYSEVPKNIIVAMFLMITDYYDKRDDEITQVFNVHGVYVKSSQLILNDYRRMRF